MNTVTSYDDADRGAIWKNERKQRSEQPDFTDNAIIDGVDWWVSGWKREPGANPALPALRLAFRRKQPVAESPPPTAHAPQAPPPADFDDDIPF